HRILRKHVSHDRRRLDHRALARLERVEARGQKRLDRGRDGDLRQLVGEAPGVTVELEKMLVYEHPEKLLRKERVALGRSDDPIEDRGVERTVAEKPLDHASRVLGVERLQDYAHRALAGA